MERTLGGACDSHGIARGRELDPSIVNSILTIACIFFVGAKNMWDKGSCGKAQID